MTPLPDAMVKLRDELAEKYRPDVPIDPEGPMLSKFMNSIHRETRDGFKAGWDAKAAQDDECLSVALSALERIVGIVEVWTDEHGQKHIEETNTSRISREAIATIEKIMKGEK